STIADGTDGIEANVTSGQSVRLVVLGSHFEALTGAAVRAEGLGVYRISDSFFTLNGTNLVAGTNAQVFLWGNDHGVPSAAVLDATNASYVWFGDATSGTITDPNSKVAFHTKDLLKLPEMRSMAGDAADAGVLRLGNGEMVAWEASPAGTDVTITADATEHVVMTGGVDVSPPAGASSWNYLRGNAGGAANPTAFTQGLTLSWNASAGNGEELILYPDGAGGGGTAPRLSLGRWNGSAKTEDFTLKGGNVGIGTTTPSSLLALGGNAARTLQMERHATSDTAGNSLTILAGGATSGATNRAGGALIQQPGLGTGSSVPALFQVQQDALGTAAGASDHARVDRLITGASKVLTDATNIALVNATVANDTSVGGKVSYCVEVVDATPSNQIECGEISYVARNNGGTVAGNTTVKYGNQQSLEAGTLTCTWTITAANPAVLTLNCDTSLTPSAGYPRVTYELSNLTQQAVAVQ
ncbi:MAG: hypothetical protein ACRD88_16510, partial [Terriglobia bacterium]